MKNTFMKLLGISLVCLALGLLLNITTQNSSSNLLVSNVHIDEIAPWG